MAQHKDASVLTQHDPFATHGVTIRGVLVQPTALAETVQGYEQHYANAAHHKLQ